MISECGFRLPSSRKAGLRAQGMRNKEENIAGMNSAKE